MNPTENLTCEEIREISECTIQKINSYPAEFGKTVEDYFELLFPDEIKNYIIRRGINRNAREMLMERACDYV